MAKKPAAKPPKSDTSRFVENGVGVKIIRPGKGQVDLDNPPPRR